MPDDSQFVQLVSTPGDFCIYGERGLMVKISLTDGSVTFGDNYDLDEIAKLFWAAMGKKMPPC